MSDEFADAPISITEARSNRSQDAADWTPRDALITALRRIDRGEMKPSAMVIVWSEDDKEADKLIDGFIVASPHPFYTLGLLTRILHRYNVNQD